MATHCIGRIDAIWRAELVRRSMHIHVHPGLHKTATTSLQQWLKINRAWYSKQGVLYLSHRDYADTRWVRYMGGMLGEANVSKLGREFRRTAKERAGKRWKKVERIVLLDERLSGRMHGWVPTRAEFRRASDPIRIECYRGVEGRLGRLSEVLSAAFPEHHLTMSVTLRAQADFLASVYGQLIKQRRRVPDWATYMEALDPASVDWNRIVDLMEMLAPGGVRVFRYEDVRVQRDDWFYAILAHMTGLEDRPPKQPERASNPSLSERGTQIARLVGPWMPSGMWKVCRKGLQHYFAKERGAPPPFLRAADRAQLAEALAEPNRRLNERCGFQPDAAWP